MSRTVHIRHPDPRRDLLGCYALAATHPALLPPEWREYSALPSELPKLPAWLPLRSVSAELPPEQIR